MLQEAAMAQRSALEQQAAALTLGGSRRKPRKRCSRSSMRFRGSTLTQRTNWPLNSTRWLERSRQRCLRHSSKCKHLVCHRQHMECQARSSEALPVVDDCLRKHAELKCFVHAVAEASRF